ncbi:MAG: hypothetical protein FWC32_12225 [Firmicutes bacterium]|nr:hypothetical protein [Bacillota bacterium]
MYTTIYAENAPTILLELADTPAMKRLKDIGMHCGCDYARFPIYDNVKLHYTRHIHSIGVANIVWHFTKDIKQAVAGLLHDISTPAFAHTIDFLQGDYMIQESTEDKTAQFIENSEEIMTLLKLHDISLADICDYTKYPIADNNTPMLSADRLEYTLGNGHIMYNMDLAEIQAIYDDLTVTHNENGVDELCFKSLHYAKMFTELSLKNSYWYVSDEDRFAMQYLADMIKLAIIGGILSVDDLYTSEGYVIEKLKGNSKASEIWDAYTKISAVSTADIRNPGAYSVNIPAKKRYINPLVLVDGTPKRIADADAAIKEKFNEFLALSFDKWVSIAQTS